MYKISHIKFYKTLSIFSPIVHYKDEVGIEEACIQRK